MNIEGYLFTVNKNNSFRLDQDEIKDVIQDLNLLFHGKSFNDDLTRKKIIGEYFKAVSKKIKSEEIVSSGVYLENFSPGTHETEVKRLNELNKLNVNDIQGKIVKLLIAGYSYKEVRKKLRMNENELKQHVKRIRQANSKV